MKCVRCGEELPDGLNFCPLCGADLTVASAVAGSSEPSGEEPGHVCVDVEPAGDSAAFEEPAADKAAFEEPSAFNPYSNFRGGGNGFTEVDASRVTPEQQAAYGAAFSEALREGKEESGAKEAPAFDPYANNRRKNEASFSQKHQSGGAAVSAPQGPVINVMVPAAEAALPDEYKPITMWGYIGYSLLFSIPLVGMILAIIFAFGGTSNVNLRNYSRSYFVLYLIGIGLAILLLIIAAAAGLFYRFG